MDVSQNLVQRFANFSAREPNKTALIEPILADGIPFEALEPTLKLAPRISRTSSVENYNERIWRYGDIRHLVMAYQSRLRSVALEKGDRVIILIPVSVRMYALAAACFAEGIIPVFIEPTMKRKCFLRCIVSVKAKAVFSVDRFFKFRWLMPVFEPRLLLAFLKMQLFTIDRRRFGVRSWSEIAVTSPSFEEEFKFVDVKPTDECLITFTTGSTGHPKAADRCLNVLFYQREISKAIWTESLADIEMSAFPLVVLNNLAFGVTTVLPMMTGPKVTDISVESIARQIERHGVQRLLAPPSFLQKICREGAPYRERFQCLQRVLTGGAPTPKWLMTDIQGFFTESECFLVYGSTEAEPIAHCNFNDALSEDGRGYLVGFPIPEISVHIVSPQHGPDRVLPQGAVGEILLSGRHVVRRYLFNEGENQKSKPQDLQGRVWHRTGDTGYFDRWGRLWITGRIKDRIQIGGRMLDAYAIEHDLENLLKRRVALIPTARSLRVFVESALQSGSGKTTETIELENNDRRLLQTKLRECFGSMTPRISHLSSLPVDSRHQWKIDRKSLREQALSDKLDL